MAVEVEFFGLTGFGGLGSNAVLYLKHPPTTGPDGNYDVAVDPTDGPAQRYGIDFGVTHTDLSGTTGAIALDLENSDIKDVVTDVSHGITGPVTLRVVYNY